MRRLLIVLVVLAVAVVLLDRGAALVVERVAESRSPVDGVQVDVSSLPTGESALWQLVHDDFGRVTLDAGGATAQGVPIAGDAVLRDVRPFAQRVARLDGRLVLPWRSLSTYVRRASPVAEQGGARLSPSGDGGAVLQLSFGVAGVSVPVRVVIDAALEGSAIVVRARSLDVAGLGDGLLPDPLRQGLLDLLARRWPLDLPPGLRVTGLRATGAGLVASFGGRDLDRADLGAAGSGLGAVDWAPRRTWATVPHALAP